MPNVVRPASREALRCGEALAHEGAAGRRAYIWRRKGRAWARLARHWHCWRGERPRVARVWDCQCVAVYGTVGLRSLLGPRTTLRLYSRVLPVFGLAGNRRASPSHALRSSQKWSVNNQRVTHLCKHLAHLKQVWGFIVFLFLFSL